MSSSLLLFLNTLEWGCAQLPNGPQHRKTRGSQYVLFPQGCWQMAQLAVQEVQVEMGKGPGCWQGVSEDPALALHPQPSNLELVSAWPSILHSSVLLGVSLRGLLGVGESCFALPKECSSSDIRTG